MPILFLVAAAVIVGGVVLVAAGRGGELVIVGPDRPLVPARLVTPLDVATLRPPLGFLGYEVHATAAALTEVARMLAERDAEIAVLREELRRTGPPALVSPELVAPDVAGAGAAVDPAPAAAGPVAPAPAAAGSEPAGTAPVPPA